MWKQTLWVCVYTLLWIKVPKDPSSLCSPSSQIPRVKSRLYIYPLLFPIPWRSPGWWKNGIRKGWGEKVLGFTGLCCTVSVWVQSTSSQIVKQRRCCWRGCPQRWHIAWFPGNTGLLFTGKTGVSRHLSRLRIHSPSSHPGQRGVIPVSASVGSASTARSQVLGTSYKARSQNRAKKSMCQHPTMLKAKASLRILVQLAHHTHLLTLPHAKESLTFVSSTWLLLWFSKSGPLPEPS